MNVWNTTHPESTIQELRAAKLAWAALFVWFCQILRIRIAFLLAIIGAMPAFCGCHPIRVPTFDPTGARIFAPEPTTIMGPFQASGGATLPNTGIGVPAYQAPPNPPPCDQGICGHGHHSHAAGPSLKERLNSKGHELHPGRKGELLLTPSRAIAPVNSEVILLSGICGGNSRYVLNQPLEWMLSNDSVGQFVEVGGTDHEFTNPIIPPSAKKIDGDYAWGRTLLKPRHITRGTPTPADDIYVKKGQAWISVTSASEGTSYITCVAPKAEAWDKRKQVTVIHWIDANWSIPAPFAVSAGQVAPLDIAIRRATDGSGVPNWKVRYEIVGGVPAEFVPTGSTTAEVLTNASGNAPIQVKQSGGQTNAGPTHIKVEIIRPEMFGQREIVVESGLTSITWSAPALSIRVLGPTNAAVQDSVGYRLEISNTGDRVARGVSVRTSRTSTDVQLISSQPKPTLFGNQFQWDLGDLPPQQQPTIIDLQWKKDAPGIAELCFELSSPGEGLRTEACAQTQIAAPCIGLAISGPDTAEQGQPIKYDLEVVNQCDQPLEKVNMQIAYEIGLSIPGLSNRIEIDLENPIMPGQKEVVPVEFLASQPGVSCFSLDIVAQGGHTAQARRCVTITQNTQPSIDLQISRITTATVGQRITTRFQVSNNGGTVLEQITLLTRFSNSIAPHTASKEFSPDWIDDELAFRIGNLAPGEQRLVEIVSICERQDPDATISGSVSTPANINDLDQIRFQISDAPNGGIEPPPAIPGSGSGIRIPADPGNTGLNVNLNSNVQAARINENVQFLVDVSNQQSVNDQDLNISIKLPEAFQYLSVDDSQSALPVAQVSADRRVVTLQTRKTIRAGETITFKVLVKAVQQGSHGIVVSAVSQSNQVGVHRGLNITITP